MTQKATIERMLDEAGFAGVRSDQIWDVGIKRGAARVEEIKKRLEAEGVGTVTSTPERPLCRYRKVLNVGVGGESGTARDVDAVALGHSSDPGGQPATPERSAPQAVGRTLPNAHPSRPQPAAEPLFGGYEIQEAA